MKYITLYKYLYFINFRPDRICFFLSTVDNIMMFFFSNLCHRTPFSSKVHSKEREASVWFAAGHQLEPQAPVRP